MDTHHPASEVTVFGARHTRDYFHRLDIVHAYASRIHSAHRSEAGVASKSHPVHLYGSGESGIACCAAALTQGKAGCCGKVRIDGLASRKQG